MRRSIVISSKRMRIQSKQLLFLTQINDILDQYFPTYKTIESNLEEHVECLSSLYHPIHRHFRPIPDSLLNAPYLLEIASILHYLKNSYRCWYQECINSDQKEYASAFLLLRFACIYQGITREDKKVQLTFIDSFLEMLDRLKLIFSGENSTRLRQITSIIQILSESLRKKIAHNDRRYSWYEIALDSRRESLTELAISSLDLLKSIPKQPEIPMNQWFERWFFWIKNIKQFCLVWWANIVNFIQRSELGPLKKWTGLRSAEKKRCAQVIQAYKTIYLPGSYDSIVGLPIYLNIHLPFISPKDPNEVGSYIDLTPFIWSQNYQDRKTYDIRKAIKRHLRSLAQAIYWTTRDLLLSEPVNGAVNRTLSGVFYQSIWKLYSMELCSDKYIPTIENKLTQLSKYTALLQNSAFLSYSASDFKTQTILFNIKQHIGSILEYIQYERDNDTQEKAIIILSKMKTKAYLFLWDIIDSVVTLCGENFELRKFNLTTYSSLCTQDVQLKSACNDTLFGKILTTFLERVEVTNNKPRVSGIHPHLTTYPKVIESSVHILKNTYTLFKLFEEVFPILEEITHKEEICRSINEEWISTYQRCVNIISIYNSEITKDFVQISQYLENESLNGVTPWKRFHQDEYTQEFHYTEYNLQLKTLLGGLEAHFAENPFSTCHSQDSTQYKLLLLKLDKALNTVGTYDNPIEQLSAKLVEQINSTVKQETPSIAPSVDNSAGSTLFNKGHPGLHTDILPSTQHKNTMRI